MRQPAGIVWAELGHRLNALHEARRISPADASLPYAITSLIVARVVLETEFPDAIAFEHMLLSEALNPGAAIMKEDKP